MKQRKQGETGETPEEKLRNAAARMRNMLDQKTGAEKRTLKKYLLVLERRISKRSKAC